MRFFQTSFKTQKSKLSVIFLSAAVITLCSATVLDRANFSGEWKLDEQKSELGQFGGRMAYKNLKLELYADSMNLNISLTSPQGDEVKRKETITFDGKENANVLSATAKKKSTAKWSDDGQSLTVNSIVLLDRNGEQMEIKLTEVWTLLNNGETLSLQSNSSSSFGENSMKLLYSKVK